MHLYLYDAFLNDNKYRKLLAKIESRITDLGISGKITRLGPISTPSAVISQEIRLGAKTIIAVGDDSLFIKIITAHTDKNTLYGYIPVKKSFLFSNLLGIPFGADACDVISARIIKKIDLGMVNKRYFISCLSFAGRHAQLSCEDLYQATSQNQNSFIIIKNLYSGQKISDPTDGLLEISIHQRPLRSFLLPKIAKNRNESKLFCKLIKIKGINNQPLAINVDGIENINAPATVTIKRQELSIIVGKNRII